MTKFFEHRIFQNSLQHPLVAKLLPANRNRFAVWVVVILLSGVLAFVMDNSKPAPNPAAIEPESPETAATFIPAGFVLVPIEVANYESLDSILGQFGVVDLYTSPIDPNQRAKKIASRLKILRAPLNPNHFAVLVAEEDSSKLISFSGPLTVVVQNPKSTGTGIVNGAGELSRFSSGESLQAPKTRKRKLSRVTIEVANVDPENETQ